MFFFFFFNDTATTEIYTLSLHDALPISMALALAWARGVLWMRRGARVTLSSTDRKSTRLNSSHGYISYAVFCLKKKKKINTVRAGKRELLVRTTVVRPRWSARRRPP